MRVTLYHFAAASVLLLGAPPVTAQQYVLALWPSESNLPNPMAALDPDADNLDDFRPPNPFIFECVAFVDVKSESRVMRLVGTGPRAWRREVLWVAPASDLSQRRRPRVIKLLGESPQNRHAIMVSLDPGDSRMQYVVGLDSAAIMDGDSLRNVGPLVSPPFVIPESELQQCGRVPALDVDLLAPDGEHAGFNVDIDAFWRRPLRIAGGGLLEFGFQTAATSAGRSTLLNTLSAGGRFELKLTRGYLHWVSVGLTESFEATERFDVVDLALGAAVRVQLDFLPVRALRRLVRRFTPYPMLNLEYNLVDRLKGSGEPEVLGRPDTEHRLRAGFDWTVPMIFGTTLRARLRADYLLSDVPAGESRLRTVNDVTFEYPMGLAEDVALVVQWLEGRAAPTYDLASRWLLGVGLRR